MIQYSFVTLAYNLTTIPEAINGGMTVPCS